MNKWYRILHDENFDTESCKPKSRATLPEMLKDKNGHYYPHVIRDTKWRIRVAFGYIPYIDNMPNGQTPSDLIKEHCANFGAPGDQAGCIVPQRFNGSHTHPDNFFPQNATVNADMKELLEKEWSDCRSIECIFVFTYEDDEVNDDQEDLNRLNSDAKAYHYRPLSWRQCFTSWKANIPISEKTMLFLNPTVNQSTEKASKNNAMDIVPIGKGPSGSKCDFSFLIEKYKLKLDIQIPKKVIDLTGVEIRNHKYDWNNTATREWMKDAYKTMEKICDTTTYDYFVYDSTKTFALETMILTTYFQITEEGILKCWNRNNIMSAFTKEQRKIAKNIRQKIQKKVGYGKPVMIQPIPVLFRPDEQVEANNSTKFCQYTLFRFQDNMGNPIFTDGNRVYSDFEDYMEANKLPQGMMCHTKDGFLRGVTTKDDKGNMVKTKATIVFGEPPSCKLTHRVVEKIDKYLPKILNFVEASAYVGSFFYPPLAIVIVGVGIISAGYHLVRSIYKIYDKSCHEENYALDIVEMIMAICTIATFTSGLRKILNEQNLGGKMLRTAEKIVNKCAEWGLHSVSILTFVGSIFAIATSYEQRQPKDIINLCINQQNTNGLLVSPAKLEELIQSVRADLTAEELRKMKAQGEHKMEEIKKHMSGMNEQEKEKAAKELVDYTEKIKSLEEEISRKDPDVTNETIQKKVEEVKNQLKNCPKDDANCKRTRDNLEKELQNWYEKSIKRLQSFSQDYLGTYAKKQLEVSYSTELQKCSDGQLMNNGRVSKISFSLEDESLFKSTPTEKIYFANGENTSISFNSELEVHQNAILSLKEKGQGKDITEVMLTVMKRLEKSVTIEEKKRYLDELRNLMLKKDVLEETGEQNTNKETEKSELVSEIQENSSTTENNAGNIQSTILPISHNFDYLSYPYNDGFITLPWNHGRSIPTRA